MKYRTAILLGCLVIAASGCGRAASGIIKAVAKGGAKAAPKAVSAPVSGAGRRIGQKAAGEATQQGIQATVGGRDDRSKRR